MFLSSQLSSLFLISSLAVHCIDLFFLLNCYLSNHVIRLNIEYIAISAKDFSLTVGLRVSCIKKIYGTELKNVCLGSEEPFFFFSKGS